jgi:glycosyltransferase involved in cell wall biosynthesis
MDNSPEISVILPCKNEELALPFCLEKIKETIRKNGLSAEIIVSDQSTDKSPEIAKDYGAILVTSDLEGYGQAFLEAFKAARGNYIFMADADGSYDFAEIPNFTKSLDEGNDMVIGNRFAGKMEKGAMPFANRYLGNPVLSGMLRLFFSVKIADSHSGMRAITKASLEKLNLQTTGMEFASEMIVKAAKNGLRIKELPINYHNRKGNSKLRPISDAWRHLRFMLLYSPRFLFFFPGTALFLAGFLSMAWFYFYSPVFWGIKLYYHPMFLSAALIIIGYQLMIFAGFAKTYAITHLGEYDPFMEKTFKLITIERAGLAGFFLALAGIIIYIWIAAKWIQSGLGSLNEIKGSIVALTLVVIGAQTVSSSFMLSVLGIKGK